MAKIAESVRALIIEEYEKTQDAKARAAAREQRGAEERARYAADDEERRAANAKAATLEAEKKAAEKAAQAAIDKQRADVLERLHGSAMGAGAEMTEQQVQAAEAFLSYTETGYCTPFGHRHGRMLRNG